MISNKTILLIAIFGVISLNVLLCVAQDENYDDENYGPNQGGNGNQDSDSYNAPNYGVEDGYSNNNNQNYPMNNQQNLDSDGSNNNPTNNQNYPSQGGSDADDDYQGDDQAAGASSLSPTIVRTRRSIPESTPIKPKNDLSSAGSEPKIRVKRHGKHYIGPVYTYVKTDKHANFKWGVKHKVGKKHHG